MVWIKQLKVVGVLMTLLRYLDPAEAEHFISGEGEVKEMLEGLGMKAAGIADDKTEVTNKATTVGSLLDK